MKRGDSESTPLPDDILSAAIEWLLEKEDGFTSERELAFFSWCAQDPRHLQAVAQAQQTLGLLDQLPLVADRIVPEPAETGDNVVPVNFGSGVRRAWWIGAAALLVLSLTVLWPRWQGSGPAVARETFTAGGTYPQQVVLDDGSFVDLNSNTSIHTEMLPGERRIEMTSGEAHFAVAHDKSRPFIVDVDGVKVRAVGTAFAIKRTEHGIEVLVTEGRVRITGPKQGWFGPELIEPTELGAAERAIIPPLQAGGTTMTVEPVSESAVAEELAWQKKLTTFADQPLREIVALFNHRGAVQLTIADPAIGNRSIGGSFALDQPEGFVRMLELDGDITADWRNDKEVILRSGHP